MCIRDSAPDAIDLKEKVAGEERLLRRGPAEVGHHEDLQLKESDHQRMAEWERVGERPSPTVL